MSPRHRLLHGLGAGVGAGACIGVANLLVSVGVRRLLLDLPPEGIDGAAVAIVAWTAVVGALLGALLGAWPGRAGWRAHLLPLPLVALALFAGAFPAAEAVSVVLGWIAWLLLARVGRRAPRATAATVFLGALAATVGTRPAPASLHRTVPAPPGAPNVLLVVFDTVRADHLPPYGYTRDTAPRLAALAAEGVVFERAYATAPWTLPSHASMFTGRYPSRHGCHDEHPFLDDAHPTLAELLRDGGWATGLFASNVWVGEATGLDRGFDRAVAAWRDAGLAAWFPAAVLLDPWIARDKGATAADAGFTTWLDGVPADRPFFAVVNYLEAHTPYHDLDDVDRVGLGMPFSTARAASVAYERFLYAAPGGPGPTPAERDALLALYDAGIRADDRHLGVLLDALAARDRLDDTLVLVVSDHGEAFGEGGRWEHHIHASEETLHIPLVLRLPGGRHGGTRVPTVASLVDLLPTTLDVVGLADVVPADVEGRSLLPLVRGEPAADRPVFAEGFPPAAVPAQRRLAAMGDGPPGGRWQAVQVGGARLVTSSAGELRHDVGDGDLEAMRRLLEAFAAGGRAVAGDGPVPDAPVPDVPVLDGEARERLRTLGYLE